MGHLSNLDYAVLVTYLLGIVALGSSFAHRQRNTQDFFLAGRRMSWFPVALSIIASDFSAISFLGTPSYVFKYNMLLLPGLLVLPMVVVPLVIWLFMGVFYNLRLITAYEYLERRFTGGLRAAASLLFILMRLSWLATAIYATSVALSQISGLSVSAGVLIIGVTTSLYTALGGMRAVIWTDVAQFFVFTSTIFTLCIVLLEGFNWNAWRIWQIAESAGRTRVFDFSLSLTNVTFWSVVIGYVCINLASYGADQVIVQRYLTTKDFRQARRSMMGNAALVIPVMMPLFFVGVGLYAYYQTEKIAIQPDRVLPYFVVTKLPHGLAGLAIAGIFAATMGSISSCLNSITTASITDFYQRYFRTRASPQHYLRCARLGTLTWGILGTGAGLVVGRLGTIVEISLKTNGFFTGVLLAIFLLGILTRRATWQGVGFGAFVGLAVVAWVGLKTPVSFLWYSPLGCLTTMLFGYSISQFFPRPEAQKIEGLVLGSPVEGSAASRSGGYING